MAKQKPLSLATRGTLFAAWAIPIVIYFLLVVLRPSLKADDFSSVAISEAIFTVGQVFLPSMTLFVLVWFPMSKSRAGRLRPLSNPRFVAAICCILAFHVITACFFYLHVYSPDYASAEACCETYRGRLNEFATTCSYLAVIPLIPIKHLSERTG